MANALSSAYYKTLRWVQARTDHATVVDYISGILFNTVSHRLPPFAGEIQLHNGLRFFVDSSTSIVDRLLVHYGNYQSSLTDLLRQHTPPGAYCLDIGANIGFYTVMMAHWAGPTGRVAAFEVNPAMVERIRQNVALNHMAAQVDVVAKAVDEKSGVTQFYLAADPAQSSISEAVNAVGQIEVETIAPDDYVLQQQWPRLDVIKIDIEGHDCAAVLGAQQIISRFQPVIALEYFYPADWDKFFSDPNPQSAAAFELLISYGYTLYYIQPRARLQPARLAPFDWRHGTGIGVNVIAIPNGREQTL